MKKGPRDRKKPPAKCQKKNARVGEPRLLIRLGPTHALIMPGGKFDDTEGVKLVVATAVENRAALRFIEVTNLTCAALHVAGQV